MARCREPGSPRAVYRTACAGLRVTVAQRRRLLGLLVSGRAIRAEHRMHLADSKARRRTVARRAPRPG